MSLKVWLPLDGDLRNLGTSDVEVTNNGATVDNAGKIGKCYSFDGTNDYIVGTYTPTTNISFCCWAYFPAILNGKHIFDGRNTAGNSGYQPMYMTTSGIQIGGSGSGYPTLSYTWVANTWYHICVTHDAQKGSLYVNGNFISSSTTAKGFNAPECNFTLGSRCNQSNHSNVKLNDVRIYDHCLSAAEVHEIAMGLVLHYKLNSMKIKTGTNLVTGVTKGGRTTILTDGRIGVQTTGENADTYFTINLSESITNGTKYFLSCDASGISEGAYWGFPLGTQSNSTLPFKIYNGHNEYSFTANDISWGSNRLFMDDQGRADWANKATFWNFELYKEPSLEIEDSSGYGHNGTIIGNPTISSDTAKYSSCTNFPTNADGILSTFPLALWNNAFTYSFWIKPSGENGGRSIYAASYNGTSCSIEKTAGNKLRFYWNGSPDLTTSSLTITDGIWQHIAIVKSEDKTKVYCYYNGELKDTFTNTFSDKTFSGNLRIARDTRGDATSYTGLMSDFRIYCTPLLDNDIKILYNIGMKVDNLGGVHTFEFDEISNEKLLKTGILQTNELEETSIQLARLQKNKGWLSSEFIEI